MRPTKTPGHHRVNEEFADTVESEVDIQDMSGIVDAMPSPCSMMGQQQPYLMHQLTAPLQHQRLESNGNSQRVLTTASLLAFCFFSVCGGPTGSEEMILAGGPFVGLIALVFFPFVFYLPLGFIVAELATALPVSGGHAYWVALAFGPSWGFQAGYWSWVSNCIDCSMYASLVVTTIVGPREWVKNTFWEFLVKATFAIVLAVPGLLRLRVIGNLALFLCLFVLLPYAVVSLWAATEATHWQELLKIRRANTTPTPDGDFVTEGVVDIDWGCLINALVWGFSGFSNLSVFAAHVKDPGRTFWRVLWCSGLLITMTYFLPFMTMAAVDKPDWRLWDEGSLGDVVKTLGGSAVAGWIMVVNLACLAGLYVCSLTSSAFLANGMAMQGIAPTTIGLNTSSGSPSGAICCSLAVILVVINLQFESLVQLANALCGLEAISLMLAFMRLRFTRKSVHRPIKLCGDAHPIFPMLLLVIPLALYGFVIYHAFQTFTTAVLTAVFLFIGLVYTYQADYTKFRNNASSTPS